MIIDVISVIAVILLGASSIFLLISQNWRYSMIALAVQYLAVFWLVGLVWTITLAAVKLVVGWMSTALIGASQPGNDYQDNRFSSLTGLIIRLLGAVLVGLLVISIAPELVELIPTGMVLIWGGLILIGMGLLQLGLSTHISRLLLSLFTLLSGFEILYAVLENSTLVAGLLAVITMGLALAGSYLLTVPSLEKEA